MALRVGDLNIALDVSDKEANVNFVSHAHSDHTAGVNKKKEIIATDVTKDLIEVRKKMSIKHLQTHNGVKMLNAGHILGSSQMYAECDGFSLLYSGDFQMRDSLVAEKIETRQADVLVIDSTYPYKDLVFEDKSEVMTAIQHYLSSKLERGIVLFGAYSLGKSQELIKIANDIGIAPVVSKSISDINKVYQKHGVELDYVSLSEDSSPDSITHENFFGIVEMSKIDQMSSKISDLYGKRVFTGVATGFAKMFRMGTEVQFELSDHADFAQSIEYIEACSPKVIYTYGQKNNQREFAEALCREGYNAHPFYTSVGSPLLKLNETVSAIPQ